MDSPSARGTGSTAPLSPGEGEEPRDEKEPTASFGLSWLWSGSGLGQVWDRCLPGVDQGGAHARPGTLLGLAWPQTWPTTSSAKG